MKFRVHVGQFYGALVSVDWNRETQEIHVTMGDKDANDLCHVYVDSPEPISQMDLAHIMIRVRLVMLEAAKEEATERLRKLGFSGEAVMTKTDPNEPKN